MNDNTKRGFKRKTIVETIERKMNKWIKSIDDKNLQVLVKNDYIVTGGAITSMLLGELPNDYDVYFQTPSVALALANYYISKVSKTDKVSKIYAEEKDGRIKVFIKSSGIIRSEDDNQQDYEYFELTNGTNIDSYLDKESFKSKTPFSVAMISSNAISLHGDIQIITRFIGSPDVIHENYDFIHVTNWFTEAQGLVLNDKALESILAKELRYTGSLYPICSMFRIKKFLNRGWTITAGEMLKIAWDISKLDLENMEVLYEQLIGVDAAYFHQLIGIMKEFKNSNPNVEFDRTYLFEAINRVFDEKSDEENEFHELVEN
jgi:hypothetical protein